MIFVLLIIYQLKHFLADFPLQNKYMLGKFKPGLDFILPLTAHCFVHALFTLLIAVFIKPELAIKLALFDFTIHFIMDRIKASPNMLGKYKALSATEFVDLFFTVEDSLYHDERIDETRKTALLKSNTYFWWALGLDQMVHHLTHYVIIYILVR